MNVLQVHYSDNPSRAGGGIVAMMRLHWALKKVNVGSKILCKVKSPEFSDSEAIPSSGKTQRLESILKRFTVRFGLNDVHCLSTYSIKKLKPYLEADILNFHGLQGSYFNFLALPYLTSEKPGILTLHDMWPFTGHCAINYGCDRWKTGCGRCPHPEATPPIRRDATRMEWKLKNWVYNHSRLGVITLSTCRTEEVKQSILKRFPIYQIPNGIDIHSYCPLDRAKCRDLLDIPQDKKVLMFAAAKLYQFNKGGDLLLKAMRGFPKSLKKEIVLLTLGDRGDGIAEAAEIPSVNLGYVANDRLKAVAYSAADLFVLPTRAESLPLVLQESMACGTPMVSFRVGGVPDVVRPGLTGYLAAPEDTTDLRAGIVQLLEDTRLRDHMSVSCRAIAVDEYSLELQVDRYIQAYRDMLRN
jgi:glycosyltransferase involved in cell wall biosynthesis